MVERAPEAGETLATPLEQTGAREMGHGSSELHFLFTSLLDSHTAIMRGEKKIQRAPIACRRLAEKGGATSC